MLKLLGSKKAQQTSHNKTQNVEVLRPGKGTQEKMRKKMKARSQKFDQQRRQVRQQYNALKFAQQHLQTWQNNYLALFNLAPVAYFVLYEDLAIKALNSPAAEILIKDRTELLGTTILDYVQPESRDKLQKFFESVFGGTENSIEATLLAADNKLFPAMIQSALIKKTATANPCCLCAVTDISNHVQQAEQLKEYYDRIEQAQKQADDFKLNNEQLCEEIDESLKNKDQQLDSLRNELDAKFDEQRKLEEELAWQKHEFGKLKDEMDTKLKFADEKMQSKTAEFEQTKTELKAELKARQDEFEPQLARRNRAKAELTEQNKKLQAAFTRKTHELAAAKQKLIQIVVRHSRVKTDLGKRGHRLAGLLKEKNCRLDAIEKLLQSEKIEYRAMTDGAIAKQKDLTRKVNLLSGELAGTTESFKTEAAQRKKAEAELAWLMHESEELNTSRTERIETLTKQLQTRIIRVKQTKDKFQTRIDKLQQTIQQKEDELVETANQLKQQANQAESLKGALDSSQHLLEKLSRAVPFTLFLYDRQNKENTYIGGHIGEVLGYSPDQIEQMGDNLYAQLMHPADLANLADKLKDFQWDGFDGVLENQFRLKDIDGNWRHINSREIAFATAPGGKVEQILGAQLDVTENAHTQNTNYQFHYLLSEKAAEYDRLLDVASCDMKQPLVSLNHYASQLNGMFCGFFKTLSQQDIEEDLIEALCQNGIQNIPEIFDYLRADISRMNLIIDSLLQLAAIRRQNMRMEPLDVNDVLAEVIQANAAYLDDADIDIEIDRLPECFADRGSFERLFGYLIDNAIKHHNPDSRGLIRVTGYREDKNNIYCIQDDGIGIPEEDLPCIFAMFKHIGSKGSNGRGMGLAVAKRIIEQHNGSITIESEPDEGCKVFIALPAHRPD